MGSERNRQKKLLIADMDSTLIIGESLDEIAAKVGKGEEIANITLQSMRGDLDFNQSIAQRVAMLKGTREDILLEIIEETYLNNGASLLAPTMKKRGAFCYIVSGGFDFLTIPIAKKIGFDGSFSNRLEVENSLLTGNVVPPILGAHAKKGMFKDEVKRFSDIYQKPLFICFDNLSCLTDYKENDNDDWTSMLDMYTELTVSYTHLRAHETPEHLVCRGRL